MGERSFERDGFVFPIRVLSRREAMRCRGCLEAAEARYGEAVEPYLRSKPHLVFTWVHDLVCHPRILDAVEEVLGPNILCRGSSFFIKAPRDGSYVSWHQDSTYWGLEPPSRSAKQVRCWRFGRALRAETPVTTEPERTDRCRRASSRSRP